MTQRIRKGQTLPGIPASTWNEFCDATDLVKRANLSKSTVPQPPGKGGTTIVATIRNSSDTEVELGRPLIYSSPIAGPTVSEETPVYYAPEVTGYIPYSDEYEPEVSVSDNWALATHYIEADGFGACATHGLAWAWVHIRAATDTTCGLNAEPEEYEDPAILVSGVAGAKIVWKQSEDDEYVEETGEQWCVVLLGGGTGGETPSAGTQLAIVTDEAAPSLWSGDETGSFTIEAAEGGRGKAILIEQLSEDGVLSDAWHMQEPEDEYQELEDLKFWIVSIYDDVPLQVGKLIKVYRVPPPPERTESGAISGFGQTGDFGPSEGLIPPGLHLDPGDEYSAENAAALGEYVKPSDYFRASSTYDPDLTQVLYHEPEDEYDERGAPIIWDGEECEES